MATTIVIDGHQLTLSIEAKARVLAVFDIGEGGVLAVRSGTHPRAAYAVRHDGRVSTYCPCKAIGRCAHRQAVDWKLEADRREAYVIINGIYEVAS